MVHDTVVIEEAMGRVQIAPSAVVAPYAVIAGPCVIGPDAYVGAHAVIGAAAQHHGTWPAPLSGEERAAGVVIEQGACVREYVTVHQGVLGETVVGAHSLVMAYSHVSHDSRLGEHVTLATGTTLGGFTSIGSYATFGQSVVTHPWALIGGGSMIGLNSSVIRDVDPFDKVAGCPAKSIGTNRDRFTDKLVTQRIVDEYARLARDRADARAAFYLLADHTDAA